MKGFDSFPCANNFDFSSNEKNEPCEPRNTSHGKLFNSRWILLVIDQRVSGSSGAANEHNVVDLAAFTHLHGPTGASFCMARRQMGHHRYITELDCVAVAQNPIRFD